MIYDQLIVFSFFPFGNGRIDHFTDLLHDLLNRFYILSKYVIKLVKKFKFLCKLIGCEAQEGAE